MRVSFGQVLLKNQSCQKTDKQVFINDVVSNVFYLKENNQPSLSSLLKRKLRADVLVQHSNDGITEVSVVSKDKKKFPFIPSLFIQKDIYGYTIFEKIEEFAEICKMCAEFL